MGLWTEDTVEEIQAKELWNKTKGKDRKDKERIPNIYNKPAEGFR